MDNDKKLYVLIYCIMGILIISCVVLIFHTSDKTSSELNAGCQSLGYEKAYWTETGDFCMKNGIATEVVFDCSSWIDKCKVLPINNG